MTTKQISLILPTRDRPKLACRLLKTIRETASNIESIEVVLYLDEDDLDSQAIGYPGVQVSKIIGRDKNMGEITNKCFARAQGRFIMLINDDMLFRSPQWDVRIVNEFARFDDGVALLYGNDLYYGKRIPTFPILSRMTCEIMGQVCPSRYKKHCIDPHILDIFTKLAALGHDRSVYMPDVVFEHMHYELSTIAYDQDQQFKDDKGDQELFFSFEEDRQNIAVKLAKHIESGVKGAQRKP